jgi:hypothetical protein
MLLRLTKGMLGLGILLGFLGIVSGEAGLWAPRADAQLRRDVREIRLRERRERHERWHVERRLHRDIRHERHEIHRDRWLLRHVRR